MRNPLPGAQARSDGNVPLNIAVIGAGISGLVAAYLLCRDHAVTVFEANDYAGGHTRTVEVENEGNRFPVDTGFIVFNEETYPHFVTLLSGLGIPSDPSTMSFSVTCRNTGLEYRPSTPDTLFADRKNLWNPAFWRMLAEILRFRRESGELLRDDEQSVTLGDYLTAKGYSQFFVENFLVPMGAAIWSADPGRFRDFPASFFVRFFQNHGFLRVVRQPQWRVVRGGSNRYVEAMIRPYRERIRLNTPVASLRRHPEYVELTSAGSPPERYDQVVVATHSDQALSLLADPSDTEKEILSALPYQENLAVLHKDTSVLPKRRKVWAAWNYLVPKDPGGRAVVTYDMNILQGHRSSAEFLVTLNYNDGIRPSEIFRRMIYHHPVYTCEGMQARKRRGEINGVNRTWYCGAYWGYGFHEDGVNSALEVCRHFGRTLS
jgi:predicted NAD/FAD-binding protein